MGWMLTLMWYIFSHPLNPIAYTYKNMWAYGNHYQVDDHEGPMVHVTYDSGMACIFKQGSQRSTWDRNIVVANLHYIGVLKEIIAMSYGGLRLALMKCSWIPINTHRNATVRQDEYGFWVVNRRWKVPTHVEPYVFPSTVSQVNPCYYYENLENHEQHEIPTTCIF